MERISIFKPAVNVTITSNNFSKGKFVVNNGCVELDQQYKGEYFQENIIHITAKPVKGSKLKSWSVKNCKYVSKSKNSINAYPRKNCVIKGTFN